MLRERKGRPARLEQEMGCGSVELHGQASSYPLPVFLPALSSLPPEGPPNALFLLYTHRHSWTKGSRPVTNIRGHSEPGTGSQPGTLGQVDQINNSASALQKASSLRTSLIITEVVRAACRCCHQEHQHIIILVLSGYYEISVTLLANMHPECWREWGRRAAKGEAQEEV